MHLLTHRVSRRLGQPTPVSNYDFSDDDDDEDAQSQPPHRTFSAGSTWFPLAKASQLDQGSLSDGALTLRIESDSSSAEEVDTVSQMHSVSARGHRRRNHAFRLSVGSDSGFEPGGSGSGTADGLCRPVLNLLDSHRTRSSWGGL